MSKSYLFQSFLLRGNHPVLCIFPDVLVNVDIVDLHVTTIGDQLHTAASLLHAEVDAEGQVQSLQSCARVGPTLLCVQDKLAETLVDHWVKECKIMKPDWSSEDELKIIRPRLQFVSLCKSHLNLP